MLRSGFAASRGALPQAEPPAVLYKAQRLDCSRDRDLDPPAEDSHSGHGELHSHSPHPNPAPLPSSVIPALP